MYWGFSDPIGWAKLRWSTFTYNYQWSDYVPIFDGWLAKAAWTVPFFGYMILFNDAFAQYITFKTITSYVDFSFGISSVRRLQLVYFGLLLLGAANIMYYLRRPFVLKIGRSLDQYVSNCLDRYTIIEYIDIHGSISSSKTGPWTRHGKYDHSEYESFVKLALGKEQERGRSVSDRHWNEAKAKHENLLRCMLTEHYFRNDTQRRASLSVCIFLAVIGLILLLVPSADLFLKVLSVVARDLGMTSLPPQL